MQQLTLLRRGEGWVLQKTKRFLHDNKEKCSGSEPEPHISCPRSLSCHHCLWLQWCVLAALALNTVFRVFPGSFTLSGSFSGFYIPLGGRFGICYYCWMGTVYSHLCRPHLTDTGDCSISEETGRVLGSLTFSFPYSSKTLVNS